MNTPEIAALQAALQAVGSPEADDDGRTTVVRAAAHIRRTRALTDGMNRAFDEVLNSRSNHEQEAVRLQVALKKIRAILREFPERGWYSWEKNIDEVAKNALGLDQ